jgi:3-hydroxyisobutyrate dehydrogenase-like beta-hydroxyacid dehydrogenase
MTNTTRPVIGVAGCGAMGLPMARAMLAKGFNVSGFDIRPVNDFGNFSKSMIESPTDFATRCEVVFCVVRDKQQVFDLCFEQQAVFSADEKPHTLVLSSTTSPAFVHALRQRLPDDVALIDAPMSGAPQAAIAATLTFMIGGDQQAITPLMPAFEAMGSKIHHLGPLGTGMTTKVLNNFVAATTVVAVRNVLHHASNLGLDKQTLLKVMNQSSGQTWFGSSFNQTTWSRETYDQSNTIGILEKDVRAFIEALPAGPEPLHDAIITALQTLPRVPA